MRDRSSEAAASGLAPDLVSRRQLIGTVSALPILLLPLGSACAAQPGPAFTPEQFGARGDGRTDDYPALVRLAAAVSRAGGGTVLFGRRRRYWIGQVQIAEGPGRNAAGHVSFEGCNGLTIDLNESTIAVRGDIHRAALARRPRLSAVNAIAPLRLNDCTDVVIRNGEIDGNAQDMTRDITVGERGGHGIMLVACTNVRLEDLHVHHCSTDGIYIRNDAQGRVCRNVRLDRIRSMNNGRQGFSNVGGVDVVAADCSFSENGRTGGSYFHAPGAGVDVEPLGRQAVRSDFRAIRCRFDDNRGSPVVCANADMTAFVELIDCSGRRADGNGRLNLAAERVVVRGGEWHNIQIACGYGAGSRIRTPFSVEVSGAVWSGDDPTWSPVYDINRRRPRVHIHDNRFVLRSPRPFARTYLFQCANENERFERNRIFVAASGHAGAGDDLIAQFAGATVIGNEWTTDLRPPRRFLNNYTGAARVSGERFAGAFAPFGTSG